MNPIITRGVETDHFDWQSLVRAYKGGLTADLMQAKNDGKWGVMFSVPPCSPEALERAGRQFTRVGAGAIRHIRRAVVRGRGCPDQVVVIVTEFPSKAQRAWGLVTAEEVSLPRHLADKALAALEAAYTPSVA